MTQDSWSRRRFVASSTGVLGSGWLTLNWPAITQAAGHAHDLASREADTPVALEALSAEDARDVEALAERIIPTTQTAGARAAGVVFFIDRALGTFFAAHASEFAAGLAGFAAGIRADYGMQTRFADLETPVQIEAVSKSADTPFFEVMRTLTILGFLASPAYGGNRGTVGWNAVGFTDDHVFKPPFGHYDRDYPGFAAYDTPGRSEST
jgi:gluconate 2-dehydrogenase gamma chain